MFRRRSQERLFFCELLIVVFIVFFTSTMLVFLVRFYINNL